MGALFEAIEEIRDFLEMGGPVLYGILIISLLLWMLIIERYWFIFVTHRIHRKRIISAWLERKEHHSWHAKKIREGMISESASNLQKYLVLIKALTSLLPLLGLLGTVAGMIETFDVMTVFGKGNPRGMATGISEALVTTMAGLVTALAGFYFSMDLRHRAEIETQKVGDRLN